MSGTRSDWAALLSLLQAFVAGAPVQRLDYSGRWVDTDQVYSVFYGGKHRIKPADNIMGVWSIDFQMRELGSVNGAIGTGTLRWEGADTDTPKWPAMHGMTLLGQAMFTPNAAAAIGGKQ